MRLQGARDGSVHGLGLPSPHPYFPLLYLAPKQQPSRPTLGAVKLECRVQQRNVNPRGASLEEKPLQGPGLRPPAFAFSLMEGVGWGPAATFPRAQAAALAAALAAAQSILLREAALRPGAQATQSILLREADPGHQPTLRWWACYRFLKPLFTDGPLES
jgi:hypothetical protein